MNSVGALRDARDEKAKWGRHQRNCRPDEYVANTCVENAIDHEAQGEYEQRIACTDQHENADGHPDNPSDRPLIVLVCDQQPGRTRESETKEQQREADYRSVEGQDAVILRPQDTGDYRGCDNPQRDPDHLRKGQGERLPCGS